MTTASVASPVASMANHHKEGAEVGVAGIERAVAVGVEHIL
jgi:hypothetical protein